MAGGDQGAQVLRCELELRCQLEPRLLDSLIFFCRAFIGVMKGDARSLDYDSCRFGMVRGWGPRTQSLELGYLESSNSLGSIFWGCRNACFKDCYAFV